MQWVTLGKKVKVECWTWVRWLQHVPLFSTSTAKFFTATMTSASATPVHCFNLAPLWVVLFFLFILFCFANALFRVPRPALPLCSFSHCTFGLSMPLLFSYVPFFFGFYCFHSLSVFKPSTGCRVNAPRLDAESMPLDYMLHWHPSTTCHTDTPGHITPQPCHNHRTTRRCKRRCRVCKAWEHRIKIRL